MRTKDELFRAAQREVAARRQQAVMQAETARRAAYAAHPALAEADNAHMRAGLGLAKAAALGGSIEYPLQLRGRGSPPSAPRGDQRRQSARALPVCQL